MSQIENEMDKILDQFLKGLISEEEVRVHHERLQKGEPISFSEEESEVNVDQIVLPIELIQPIDLSLRPKEEPKREAYKAQPKENKVHQYAGAAGIFFSILFLVPLIYMLFPTNPGMDVYRTYFEPYDISFANLSFKENQPSMKASWDGAANAYANRDYKNAIQSFNGFLSNQPKDSFITHFYLGISYLASNQYREAVEQLSTSKRGNTGNWEDEINWYLAIAQLMNGNNSEFKRLMSTQASNLNSYHSSIARQILDEKF